MKKVSLLVFFALIAQFGFGQNSILWEITGNDLIAPSYLMGTLKFIGEKEFYLPEEAVSRLKKCKIFAIEDQVDHQAQMEINKAIHFPKGKTLSSELSPEDYAKVTAFFEKEFHIPKAKFEKDMGRMIPLALSINMTRMSLGEKVKYYDIELLRLAKQYKLQTYSLEPIAREAKALHAFPLKDQEAALLHSISNFEKQKSEYVNLEAAYVVGDLDKVFEYSLHPTENNPLFIQEFYTARNLEWLPKIDRMVHSKQSFIAIGVSHLEGEQGLLALLRSKGFTLTPVPLKR